MASAYDSLLHREEHRRNLCALESKGGGDQWVGGVGEQGELGGGGSSEVCKRPAKQRAAELAGSSGSWRRFAYMACEALVHAHACPPPTRPPTKATATALKLERLGTATTHDWLPHSSQTAQSSSWMIWGSRMGLFPLPRARQLQGGQKEGEEEGGHQGQGVSAQVMWGHQDGLSALAVGQAPA